MYLHKIGGSWLSHPFLRNSFLVADSDDVRRILEAGIDSVWIDEAKGDALQDVEALGDVPYPDPVGPVPDFPEMPVMPQGSKGSRDSLRKPGATPLTAEIERARGICLAGKTQIRELFGELRLGNTVSQQSVLPLVEEIQASVWRNPTALISVARLKSHDDYSYLHSVAVSALMLALARQLGLDAEQTRLAGIGGLMHDLGKAFMPVEILNKPGKLTDDEFEIMKTHSAAGAQALREGGAEAGVVVMCVL
jgi:putative nucleotidyltransferase with HDIG domain